MDSLVVCALGSNETVSFAAQELARYLEIIGGVKPQVTTGAEAPAADALTVGVFVDFPKGFREWPSVPDARWDDAIVIDIKGGRGIIAGSTPHSVLIAVYRTLREYGCRWVRPGAGGEYLPKCDIGTKDVQVTETASYRHRGLCIEGAVSYEHVRDIIDWSPKVGLNSYFTQFREAYTFFERWYAHRSNPLKTGRAFPIEEARKFKQDLSKEISKRGLVFHDVGHGWTCEPLGISGLGWEYEPPEIEESQKQYLALVNGKRELWGGVPLNTNLCYSNPVVRQMMEDDIVDYATQHPEVDVIHFWLADGTNNQCECDECAKMLPSDWFLLMLNELDEKLTKEGLPTRIVFLAYVDLLWPPEKQTLKNRDRFILMFAPITRSYSKPFATDAQIPEIPPFKRNHLEFPSDVGANLAFLKAWQKVFPGDGFDFDYHFMWDHYKDPGYVMAGDILQKDMRNLKDIGLNGMISCQGQRVFLPTGLPMLEMAETLWNRDADPKAMETDYFAAAFGPEGELAAAYLHKLTDLCDPSYIRYEKPQVSDEAAARFVKAAEAIKEFHPVIKRNLHLADPCQARSWHYLEAHGKIWTKLAEAFRQHALGHNAKAKAAWQTAKVTAQEMEDDLQTVLDIYEFVGLFDRIFTD